MLSFYGSRKSTCCPTPYQEDRGCFSRLLRQTAAKLKAYSKQVRVVRPIFWAILLRFLKDLGHQDVESASFNSYRLESLTEEVTLEIYRSFFVCFTTIQAFENAVELRVCSNPNANLRVVRDFLFCKDGAICAKNSPKRISHGVARAVSIIAVFIPDYGSW